MTNLKRHLLLLALAGAAAAPGCGRAEHAGLAPDVRRELEAGREAVNTWLAVERSGSVPEDHAVVGLGYAERLRLGLGSPFRLVEQALRDPRLPEDVRRQVAWALLARTLTGDAYEVDAVALDRAGVAGIASWPGLGRHHLNLIENAITESLDPRSGELAVRLAYQLAAMEGSLPAHAPMFATRAAALIRDRELARADVARLLRSAEAVQGDPLRAISRWRSERWLRVEAPALMPLSPAAEREALELAPRLAQALRMLSPRIGDVTASRPSSPDVRPPLLTPATARRLLAIADSLNAPPLAPVGIAARTYRQELVQQPWLTEEERTARERFTRAATEERFVAEYAQLDRRSPHDAAPSLAAVWAGTALRAYAQEPVWFPGFGGPSARELEERFGLASVRFGEEVPAEWRPYYRGMLEVALQDMQRVLPALDLRGLAVEFGMANRGEATLAMHDPKRRRLVLPPGSAAGTLAHEVAHDLDWQVALRRYRVRGDYASDRAARSTSGDRLASRVRNLAPTAALDAGSGEAMHGHAHRPAENFARAVDWFVAAALAAQGRSNGFLSSIQDDVLTGYGTVRPPDITGRAGDALIDILDEVAPLYPETRVWFLKSYGTGRALGALDLMRSMLEIELPEATPPMGAPAATTGAPVASVFRAITAARERGFAAVDDWACRAPGGAPDARLEQARRRLVVEAAAARGRALALQHARQLGGARGARWVARRLYGGPWPAQDLDEGMEALLEGLVVEARAVAHAEVQEGSGMTFQLLRPRGNCSPLGTGS